MPTMKYKERLNYKPKYIATFVCVLVALATVLSTCVLTLSSCGPKSSPGDSSYVKVTDKGKTIKAEIPVADGIENKEIYLFSLEMWQNADKLSELEPIAKAKISSGEAKAEIDVEGKLSEALCRGYMFAQKSGEDYIPVTGIYYVTNPRNAIENVKGKEGEGALPLKGAIGTSSQLLELGAGSTVVTVNISSLMSASGGRGTIPYVWSGLTYYANRDAVEALDQKIIGYTNAGIYVYLELVQTSSKAELPENIKNIVFDAPSGKKGYALNMTDREGSARICGLFDLLAQRYGNGGDYGRAEAFIVGRRVNDMNHWYAGSPSGEQGMANYLSAVRAAYNILLSNTPNGRVYIAADNGWSVAESGNFTVRDMLSSFNNLASAGGDFFWQVAVEANPSDASDSSIWDDPMASGRSDFLSPSNIEVLDNQLASDMYKRGGQQRHMLLNRFAVGGYDEDSRAASYAYAYYKCLSAGCVDGLIYGVVADIAGDNSGTGLFTAESSMSFSARKRIADIFATIDDENCEDLAFVSTLIGNKWDHIYKKNSNHAAVRSSVYAAGGNVHSNVSLGVIADFSGGDMMGFGPCASAEYAELRYSSQLERPALYAPLSPNGYSNKAGVISSAFSTEMLRKTGYLGVTLKADSGGSGATVTLRISGTDNSGKERVFLADADVPSNTWTDVYFDINDFIENIDSETVMFAVLTRASETPHKVSGLWLSSIVSEAPAEEDFPVWIIVVLIIAAAGVGLFFFVKWFRKNYTFVRE